MCVSSMDGIWQFYTKPCQRKHPPYDGGGSGLACCALIAASNAA